MPYRGDSLADLGDDRGMLAAGRRTAERVADDLHERVVRHTPVAKPPAASVAAEWQRERRRRPGHLKDSWRVGEVTVKLDGEEVTVDVYTLDLVAPHVEWDTQPHLIVPKDPGGLLRYWNHAGETVFAKVVHHPGTRGQHMMATSLVEVAATWESIGSEEMSRWASEHFRMMGR